MGKVKLKRSISIRCPPEEVFKNVATDYFKNRPRRYPELLASEKVSEGPMRVGTIGRELSEDRWGRRIETTVIVTEYEPNRKFAAESTLRFAEHQPNAKAKVGDTSRTTQATGSILLEAVDHGTRATFSSEYEYPVNGLYRL